MTADPRFSAAGGPAAKHSIPTDRWLTFLVKAMLCLVLVLAPWPGVGSTWSDTLSSATNSFLVPIFSNDDDRILYKLPDPDGAPWRVKAYFGQRSTRQTAAYDVEARPPYLSLATYIALAAATLWHRRRIRKILLLGLPALIAVLALNQAVFIELALCELGWRTLPDALRMLIQLPFMTLNSLLGMTFAVPGFVWWLCLDRSRARGRVLSGAQAKPDPAVSPPPESRSQVAGDNASSV